MKLHKTVTSLELENACRDGWQIDPHLAPTIEKRWVELRPTYNGPGTDRSKFEFGDVTIFVVWKDADTESREQQLARHNGELVKQLGEALEWKRKYEAHEKTITQLQEANADLNKKKHDNENYYAAQLRGAADKNRKLEEDLAKVRAAIGDLRWKEILG